MKQKNDIKNVAINYAFNGVVYYSFDFILNNITYTGYAGHKVFLDTYSIKIFLFLEMLDTKDLLNFWSFEQKFINNN